MKFAGVLKSVALASALAASSSFAAGYTFVDGSTSLTLSQDILGVYALLGVATVAQPGSTSSVTTTPATPDQSYDPVTSAQPTTSVVTAGADNSILVSSISTGSGVNEVRGSNTVSLRNFVLDNTTQTLYADMYTNQGTYMHQAFLKVDPVNSTIVGDPVHVSSTAGADGYYHATGTITNLILDGTWDAKKKVATGALAIIANGLGVTGVSVGAAYGVNIGDLQIDTRFSAPAAAVPEPSTYAMLLAGVAGVGFMARRRKAA